MNELKTTIQLVEPSVELLPEPDTSKKSIYKHIEKIGRICYKSEDRITDDSAQKFIKMLNKNKHWAMLEHYVFRIYVTKEISSYFKSLRDLNDLNIIEHLNYIRFIPLPGKFENHEIMVASPAALNHLLHAIEHSIVFYGSNNIKLLHIAYVYRKLHDSYPDLVNELKMGIPFDTEVDRGYPIWNKSFDAITMAYLNNEDIINIIETINTHYNSRIDNLDHIGSIPYDIFNETYKTNECIIPCKIYINNLINYGLIFSAKFITDRGVSHELVRHRPASYAQESTRYCNYSVSKDKSIFIINNGIEPIDGTLNEIAAKYNELIESGEKPQHARRILPNCLKTEIICTANLAEWMHIFHMRCDPAAHPDIRKLAISLYKDIDQYFTKTNSYEWWKAISIIPNPWILEEATTNVNKQSKV